MRTKKASPYPNWFSRKIIYPKIINPDDFWSMKGLILSKISYGYARMVGDIDYAMIPYLKRINRIPGIYTVYGCTGHKNELERGDCRIGYITICAKDRNRAYRILSRFEDDYDDLCFIDEYPTLCVRWHYPKFQQVMDKFVTTLEVRYPESEPKSSPLELSD